MIVKAKLQKLMWPKKYEEEKFLHFTIAAMKLEEVIEGDINDLDLHKTFKTFTMKGNSLKLDENSVYEIKLGEKEITEYGANYKICYVNRCFNTTLTEDEEVLAYGVYYSTSSDIADRILEEYSIKDFMEIVENEEYEALKKIKGIGDVYSKKIIKKMNEYIENGMEYNKLLVKLNKFGLSMEEIKMLVSNICVDKIEYKPIEDFLNKTPYDMVLKNWLSFKRTDEIAISFGNNDKVARMEALIVDNLRRQAEGGKSFLYEIQFNNIMYKNIPNLKPDIFCEAINNLHNKKYILIDNKKNIICLKEYYDLERNIAKRIIELLFAEPLVKKYDKWLNIIKNLEIEQGWNYTDEQMNGIETCLNNNIVMITGYAGTGKTTITNGFNRIYEKIPTTLCALAGKAAQRMSQVTGLKASTIFKVLMQGEPHIIVEVDESTMINGQTFLQLLNSITPGSKVLLLGDIGQLQSIGSCNVFADLINSGLIPVVNLTKIHRQAKKSAITTESINIRHKNLLVERGFYGEVTKGELQDLTICCPKDIMQKTIEKFFEQIEIEDILEVQIITPMREKGAINCLNINKTIQKMYNKNAKEGGLYLSNNKHCFFEGDKVINRKNNYSIPLVDNEENGAMTAIFNGSIGIVKSIDPETEEMIVDFQFIGEVVLDKDKIDYLDLAYAITVHSSQGSQWNVVIAALNNEAGSMLKNEMLYTSITRAGIKCFIVSESYSIITCCENFEQNNKQTMLKGLLLLEHKLNKEKECEKVEKII